MNATFPSPRCGPLGRPGGRLAEHTVDRRPMQRHATLGRTSTALVVTERRSAAAGKSSSRHDEPRFLRAATMSEQPSELRFRDNTDARRYAADVRRRCDDHRRATCSSGSTAGSSDSSSSPSSSARRCWVSWAGVTFDSTRRVCASRSAYCRPHCSGSSV